jgi:hypothetical protein
MYPCERLTLAIHPRASLDGKTARSLNRVAAALLLFLGTSSLVGADIVVRLINARKGVPLPRKPVRLWSMSPPGPWGRWDGYLEAITGPEGAATFHVKNPLPESLIIHTGMGGYWEECLPNDRAGFDVREILVAGISKEGHCPPNVARIDQKFEAKPGEVYVFVSHLSLWERIRYCNKWGCR